MKKTAQTPRILAIDLGRKMGWACSDGDYGVHHFEWNAKTHMGKRGDDMRVFLTQHICRAWASDAIAVEVPTVKGAARRQFANMLAAIDVVCHSYEIPCKCYGPPKIKKHATGSGRADKSQMIDAAKQRGFDLSRAETDDVIDALWLLDLALNDTEWTGGITA